MTCGVTGIQSRGTNPCRSLRQSLLQQNPLQAQAEMPLGIWQYRGGVVPLGQTSLPIPCPVTPTAMVCVLSCPEDYASLEQSVATCFPSCDPELQASPPTGLHKSPVLPTARLLPAVLGPANSHRLKLSSTQSRQRPRAERFQRPRPLTPLRFPPLLPASRARGQSREGDERRRWSYS